MGSPAGPSHSFADPCPVGTAPSTAAAACCGHDESDFQASLQARFAGATSKRQARRTRGNCGSGRSHRPRRTAPDPRAPAEIELFAIGFASSIHLPAKPIHWRLLTTHDVETVAQALTVIGVVSPALACRAAVPYRQAPRAGYRAEHRRERRCPRKARRHRTDRRLSNHAARARPRFSPSRPAGIARL